MLRDTAYHVLRRYRMSLAGSSAHRTVRTPVNSRRYCFTLNNYTDDDFLTIQAWSNVDYLVVGRETAPTTGTPHLQGYVVFRSAQRPSAVHRLLPSAHWQIANGTSTQNREYCIKGGDYVEEGENPDTRAASGRAAGASATSDKYKRAWDQAKVGDIEAIDASIRFRHYFTCRAISKDFMVKPPDLTYMPGVWIYGPPGTGKSFTARNLYPDAYMKMQNKWWDGYQGEEHVLLDDFDMKELGHHLKIWADKYSFLAESKGSARHIRPARFIITSNYAPSQLFGHDPILLAAIVRRFDLREMTDVYVPPVPPESLQSFVGSEIVLRGDVHLLPSPTREPSTAAASGRLLHLVHDVSEDEVLEVLEGGNQPIGSGRTTTLERDYFMSRVTAPRRPIRRPRPPSPLPPGQRTLL